MLLCNLVLPNEHRLVQRPVVLDDARHIVANVEQVSDGEARLPLANDVARHARVDPGIVRRVNDGELRPPSDLDEGVAEDLADVVSDGEFLEREVSNRMTSAIG